MAAEQLSRVRIEFIGRATKPTIKDLLGYLLKEKIISEREKESVTEDNTSRADQAEAFIDIVRKKGDEASERMIAHLQSIDCTLYNQLALGLNLR